MNLRVILTMLRASWLSATSYRVQYVYSTLGSVASVVPLFFIAQALQRTMQGAIQHQGGQYFAFVLVGLIAQYYLVQAVNAVPGALGSTIGAGTLDSLMATPTPLPVIITGMSAYSLTLLTVRSLLMLAFGYLLGANVEWRLLPIGIGVLLLVVLAYLPIGLLSAALVIAFRTDGPLRSIVLLTSSLLGGVLYPTHVIPAWLQQISAYIPLTYGLRALRRVILEGESLLQVADDLGMLLLFCAAIPLGVLVLWTAFQYARREGTLTQY